MENEDIKKVVKEKYSQIASEQEDQIISSCCCGAEPVQITMIGDEYTNVEGHIDEADLGLGCGVPTEYADIKSGNTVVDLGCGAGNDVFIARRIVGESGKVIGIDMTMEMIEKARKNNEKLGFKNVEFHLAEIESMPIADNSVDVVISNCVLNLVPDKQKAFNEIYRILKPQGHFCISDVVVKGALPGKLRTSSELYASCIAGAVQMEEYLQIIQNAGFINVEIKKSKNIFLPYAILQKFMTIDEVKEFRKSGTGIFSITVVGFKD
ncbi:MAG: arsenite methyltransferase [Ignavibacteria bacterium]|nr:arsenite methyltransferase [Ignavibacteria bacterium]